MRTGVLVQARMSSRRLPQKVLRALAGRPLLLHLLDGVRRAHTVDLVAVTTSLERADDRIAAMCREHDVECFRGPLDDVNLRVIQAAEYYELDTVVRVSGDSPLLDYRLVDRAVSLFGAGEHDLVTNVFPRSFPRGQSVETCTADVLRRARGAASREQLEHVTAPVYDDPERYRIHNFSHTPSLAHLNMSVDTAEDAVRVDRMLRSLTQPVWTYPLDELVEQWEMLERDTASP